jgi:hypothetical protein
MAGKRVEVRTALDGKIKRKDSFGNDPRSRRG